MIINHTAAAAALLVASLLSLSSCALPLGRVKFDPQTSVDDVPVHVAANNDGATLYSPRSDLDFYEFRRVKTPPASLLHPAEDPYRLGAGDRLNIEVVEAPETRSEAVVMPDGMLYYDVAEGVMAAGRTLGQVEKALAKQLEDDYAFPIVTASLMTPVSRSYTILGQIQKPGSFPLTRPTTLLDAIAEAGGSGSAGGGSGAMADLPRSVVIRQGKMLPVNFKELIESGNKRHNIYLKGGDYVFMPAEGKDRVYVLGAVQAPSAVPYSSRVNLVTAIASAQGLADEAFPQGTLVVRGSFANPKFAPVNLNKVIKGQQPNFALLPGDIIWVPQKPWQKLSEYAKFGIAAAVNSYTLRETSKLYFSDDQLNPTSAASVPRSGPSTTGSSASTTSSASPTPGI